MAGITIGKEPLARIRSDNSSTFRRVFFSINWLLLLVAFALVCIGLLTVRSATQGRSLYSFNRQLMGVGISIGLMVAFWAFDYRQWERFSGPLLVLSILFLVAPMVPGLGDEVDGGRRWISIFGQQVQPSEFAKIIVILMMASLLAKYKGKLGSSREYLKCLGYMFVPMVCVMVQPDLGTALVYLAIGMTVLFVGGANRWYIALTVVIGSVFVIGVLTVDPILDGFFGRDVLLKEYQVNRLLVFLNEDLDPTGLGYNLRQSKIAIGSGGWTGVGYMQGTQSGLGFLPAAPTDFIFCVLAEEFGFFGALVLISLYVALILICLRVALRADAFGALIVAGCIGMWVFQVLQNIGMTCGLMPITGIPLPFMSYGSSFMVVNFCAVGLIASISMRSALDAQARPSINTAIIRNIDK
ncbi:MAG: rod shape-determining protein RodA [Coriobacteriia bacterium]|nr:rod shape-determining protein RodA [Coriobacteriia bacterium]